MSDVTALDQADAMIEKAWGRPIGELETMAVRRPVEDPLLRSAMHIRSSLVIYANAAAVHQERLHALTRMGRVPAFYDNKRVTDLATELRVALAESQVALQAISHVIEARANTQQPSALGDRLARAAVARSSTTAERATEVPTPRAAGAPAQQAPAWGPGR